MDDGLLNRMSRALVVLENLGRLLDGLLVPSGGGKGSPSSVKVFESKPPLSVAVLDLKVEVEDCLRFWVHQSQRAMCGVEWEPAMEIVALARCLRSCLCSVESQPWSEQMAHEVIHVAWLVQQTIGVGEGVRQ